MRKFLLFIAFILFSSTIFAFDYNDLANLKPQELRSKLHDITSEGHQPLTYQEAKWNLYNKVYVELSPQGSTFVRDVYCGQLKTSDRTLAPYKAHVNIEHSWPRSKFNIKYEKAVQEADMYHLYITDKAVNNQRANHPFGEVWDAEYATGDCEMSQIGLINSRDYPVSGTQIFFQPPEEIRGDIARGLFYFAVRYDLRISSVQEYFLKKWNHDDPVSDFEKAKLERVQKIQGNVNPFILHPELVDLISDF